MSNSLFDPKMYKHVTTGKDFTVLKHKNGHQIRIAHNAISPKMRTALEALSSIPQENATDGQRQEAEDANQYGKVIQKADGGRVKYADGGLSSDPYQNMHDAAAGARKATGDDAPTPAPVKSSPGPAYHEEQWSTSQSTPYPGSYQDTHPEAKAEGGEVDEYDQPEDLKQHPHKNSMLFPEGDTPDQQREGQKRTNQRNMEVNAPYNADSTKHLMSADREEFAQGGNAGEQRKKIYGKQSSPSNPAMREKHIKAIQDFAKSLLNITVNPSGGKIDAKTGKRRDPNAEVGVDKPDWRSGQLESQWNPDAMMHELAHVALMPKGVGLKKAQELMDKQYGDVQKKYGYMQQKRSQGEVQPMAAENILRRHLGLPPATQSVPVKEGEGPRTAVEDPNMVIGTRVNKGNKTVDLIRQSRNLSPENRQRLEHIVTGKIKFHPEYGWQENPDALGAKSQMYKEEHPEAVKKMKDGGDVENSEAPPSLREPKQMPMANNEDQNTGDEFAQSEKTAKKETLPQEINRNSDEVLKSQQAPPRIRLPQDQPDLGGVSNITGQKPGVVDTPEETPEYKALLDYHKMQAKKGQTTKHYDPATGKFSDVEVRGTLGGGPNPEDQASKDYQRNQDVIAHPEAHSPYEREQVASQQAKMANTGVTQYDQTPDQGQQPPQSQTGIPTQADYDKTDAAISSAMGKLPTSAAQNGIQASDNAGMVEPGAVETSVNAVDTTPKTSAQNYQDTMNQLNGHWQSYLDDRAAGHIQPKTLHDLFANKDTIGKIGMLAGLVIGGWGAGLQGKDNPVLAQLNQTITNDIAAQQNSAGNAQNLFRINQQGLMNQAGIEDTQAGIRAKAQALTWNQMAYEALDKMSENVSTMPEGPQKQEAQQRLAMTFTAVGNMAKSVNATAAAMDAQSKAFFGTNRGNQQPNDPVSKENNWQQRMNSIRLTNPELAKQMSDYHIPYMDGRTSVPVSEPVKMQLTAMNTLDMQAKDVLKFANQYKYYELKGLTNLPEAMRIRAQGQQKAAELVQFYSGSIKAGAMTEGRLAWLDGQVNKNPASTWAQITAAPAKVEEIARANAARRDQLLYGPEVGFVPADNNQSQGQQQTLGQQPGPAQGQSPGEQPSTTPKTISATAPSGKVFTFPAGTKLPNGWRQNGR